MAMPYLVSSPALARHPSAHLLIIRHPALAVLLSCSGLLWQGKASSSMLMLLVEAAHVHGFAARAAVRQCTSRGTARQAEPRRGSWCYRGRYGAWRSSRPSCSSPSMPITQPIHTALCPGYLVKLGTALGRYMHACAAGRVQNVKSSKSVPPRTGPTPQPEVRGSHPQTVSHIHMAATRTSSSGGHVRETPPCFLHLYVPQSYSFSFIFVFSHGCRSWFGPHAGRNQHSSGAHARAPSPGSRLRDVARHKY